MQKFKRNLGKVLPDINTDRLHTALYDIVMNSEKEEYEMIK